MDDANTRRGGWAGFAFGIAAAILSTSCGGEAVQIAQPDPLGTNDATTDASRGETEVGAPDDGGFDIDVGAETKADTAKPEDTGADTAVDDGAPADTGPEDTGPEDTGPEDTGPEDTGTVDTWTPPVAPTVTISLPAANAKLNYNKNSDACQSQVFRVEVEAPGGLKSLQWKFFTPNAAGASTGMLGTCNGLAAYGYFVDPAKYTGVTSAAFESDVAIAGLYSGPAGAGRWWWCTAPGTEGMASIASPPAPGAPAVQTLSNNCAAKGTPSDSDLASRWRLEVIAVDLYGNTTTSELRFWVHQ